MLFAANCGISTETLSLIERERADPTLSTMQKLAAYTGCTVAELLEVSDEGEDDDGKPMADHR